MSQLARGAKGEGDWAVLRPQRWLRLHMYQHWNRKRHGFPAACLCHPQHVTPGQDAGNCARLYWCWSLKALLLEIPVDPLRQRHQVELKARPRRLASRELDLVCLVELPHLLSGVVLDVVVGFEEVLLERLVLYLRVVEGSEALHLGEVLPYRVPVVIVELLLPILIELGRFRHDESLALCLGQGIVFSLASRLRLVSVLELLLPPLLLLLHNVRDVCHEGVEGVLCDLCLSLSLLRVLLLSSTAIGRRRHGDGGRRAGDADDPEVPARLPRVRWRVPVVPVEVHQVRFGCRACAVNPALP
mmetsp:Transcript_20205/g.49563  ORF Transcript_20205/g.49563 Transcript_20205/m.49563 type:complete len:301 (+) Transcript_20205:1915-2817(+)